VKRSVHAGYHSFMITRLQCELELTGFWRRAVLMG